MAPENLGRDKPGRGTGKGGPPRGRGEGRGGGRGDKRGGRGGGKGRDERGGGSSSAEYRVVQELSSIEKSLTKKDLASQKQSLESIVKALRPLHLRSLEQLDFTARGRLLTTILRVQRQPKPAPGAAPESAPAAEAPAAEAPPAEAAPSEGVAAEAAAEPQGAEAVATGSPDPGTEGGGAEAGSPGGAPVASAHKEPAVDPGIKLWTDIEYLVGQVWRAVGDQERAKAAFELSGRDAGAADAPVAAEPSAPRAEGASRPPRERGDRKGRPERAERAPRPSSEPLTDWQLRARDFEESGRTRDAAKMHAQHKNFVEAGRLYIIGNDKKAALKAYVQGKDLVAARALMKDLKPEEFRPVLEQAQGWELLMEHYVAGQDFDSVAKLYERARQFDQAALAWERAGKLTQARKAFERANDAAGAGRMRDLEVQKLIERGDRLGAAKALVTAGEKEKALEVLKALPPPKAFRFMQRLKLDAEATALAQSELSKAEAENRHASRARWLETLGETDKAADAWLQADRKDKALPLFEKTGNLPKAAELAEAILDYDKAVELFRKAGDSSSADRVAALPKPEKPPEKKPEPDAEEADEAPATPPDSQ